MSRRVLLLSSALTLCAGLLGTTPAAASASAGVAVSVAKVRATPAKQSGACPTTVGFSAVLSAKGKGTVRYRWVRGDGSKGAFKTAKVRGAKRIVVKDRQTFERSTSGWQAVQVAGRKGLSAKARFTVTCAGPLIVYDNRHPLPPSGETAPVEAAASVTASPASHNGACPVTVTFTGTLQVSRVPAKASYQWVDDAEGESAPQTAEFGRNDPRTRTVSLTLPVTNSRSGWKAIRVLGEHGHDSGRATYSVTCQRQESPVDVAVEAEWTEYAGRCPTTTNIYGARLKAKTGPLDVTFRWLDDKGNAGEVQTAHFTKNREVRYADSLQRGYEASAEGWHGIEILTPVRHVVTYPYRVTCDQDEPAIRWANLPIPYVEHDDCGNGVQYGGKGRIELPAGPARDLSWTVLFDGVRVDTGTLTFPGGTGTRYDVTPSVLIAELNKSGTHHVTIRAGNASMTTRIVLVCV
ncbi:hypothetical protein [Streptosporangium sp. NPDC049376]|uniref:hypothetical protein n=1 Tax=Streptosporangium sp. NPDC049376 TaxID=3366192 RepID=UPI0037B7824D